jgi:hypothetical protein
MCADTCTCDVGAVADEFVRALPDLAVVSADTYRQVLRDMDKTKDQWTEERLRS